MPAITRRLEKGENGILLGEGIRIDPYDPAMCEGEKSKERSRKPSDKKKREKC